MRFENEEYGNEYNRTDSEETQDLIELKASEIEESQKEIEEKTSSFAISGEEEMKSNFILPEKLDIGVTEEEVKPNFILPEKSDAVMLDEEEVKPYFVTPDKKEEVKDNLRIQGEEIKQDNITNTCSHSEVKNGFQKDILEQNNMGSETSYVRRPATYRFSKQDGDYSQQNQKYTQGQQSNGGNSMPPKRKDKNLSFGKQVGKLVVSAAVFGVVAGLCFQGVQYGTSALFPQKQESIQLPTTSIANGTSVSTKGSVSQVANSSMPAIVAITSTVESIQNGFFGQQYRTEGTGSGSGIIISKDAKALYIATNHHVVDGATKVQVTFYHDPNKDGSGEIVDATIVGNDPDSDLAVVKVELDKIQQDTLNEIKVASLGTSSDIEIGQQVVAIGNALGYGQSVTSGYISALNRQVQLEDKTMTLMQTDAAINPGNSGGALINMNGEVIGINSAKYSESGVEGMGYAIPMDTARPILEDIMNESSVPEDKQAYLGITGATISDEYRQYMGNNSIPSGVYVATVTSGSPAEQGGLYANDIITKLNDREVSTMEGLQSILARKQAGDEVTITVKRQNQNGEFDEKTLTVRLGKKTEAIKAQQSQQIQQEQQSQQREYYRGGNSRSSSGEDEFWSFFN